jgi:DNA-binding PadR family transcriptional regulator
MKPRPPSVISELLPLRSVEFHVLLTLAQGDRHGYAILQETERLTDGALVLEPGTLYRALRRMLQAGLVAESRAEAGADERRRYYRLTDLGRRVAGAEADRLARLVGIARAGRLLGKA